uniref:C2 domain-containing protein n=1 Tax=Macrostomum lignano TaxID=282301 RepID=A0A1I8HZ84_9PLAT
ALKVLRNCLGACGDWRQALGSRTRRLTAAAQDKNPLCVTNPHLATAVKNRQNGCPAGVYWQRSSEKKLTAQRAVHAATSGSAAASGERSECSLNFLEASMLFLAHLKASPSSQGALDFSGESPASRRMFSGRGSECLTMAPYKPYSAMMEDLPQVFSVLRHLARRFWNHTWILSSGSIMRACLRISSSGRYCSKFCDSHERGRPSGSCGLASIGISSGPDDIECGGRSNPPLPSAGELEVADAAAADTAAAAAAAAADTAALPRERRQQEARRSSVALPQSAGGAALAAAAAGPDETAAAAAAACAICWPSPRSSWMAKLADLPTWGGGGAGGWGQPKPLKPGKPPLPLPPAPMDPRVGNEASVMLLMLVRRQPAHSGLQGIRCGFQWAASTLELSPFLGKYSTQVRPFVFCCELAGDRWDLGGGDSPVWPPIPAGPGSPRAGKLGVRPSRDASLGENRKLDIAGKVAASIFTFQVFACSQFSTLFRGRLRPRALRGCKIGRPALTGDANWGGRRGPGRLKGQFYRLILLAAICCEAGRVMGQISAPPASFLSVDPGRHQHRSADDTLDEVYRRNWRVVALRPKVPGEAHEMDVDADGFVNGGMALGLVRPTEVAELQTDDSLDYGGGRRRAVALRLGSTEGAHEMGRKLRIASPSPSPNRASPSPNRASPSPNRASPSPNRASPSPNRQSESQQSQSESQQTSPSPNRASPSPNRASPSPNSPNRANLNPYRTDMDPQSLVVGNRLLLLFAVSLCKTASLPAFQQLIVWPRLLRLLLLRLVRVAAQTVAAAAQAEQPARQTSRMARKPQRLARCTAEWAAAAVRDRRTTSRSSERQASHSTKATAEGRKEIELHSEGGAACFGAKWRRTCLYPKPCLLPPEQGGHAQGPAQQKFLQGDQPRGRGTHGDSKAGQSGSRGQLVGPDGPGEAQVQLLAVPQDLAELRPVHVAVVRLANTKQLPGFQSALQIAAAVFPERQTFSPPLEWKTLHCPVVIVARIHCAAVLPVCTALPCSSDAEECFAQGLSFKLAAQVLDISDSQHFCSCSSLSCVRRHQFNMLSRLLDATPFRRPRPPEEAQLEESDGSEAEADAAEEEEFRDSADEISLDEEEAEAARQKLGSLDFRQNELMDGDQVSLDDNASAFSGSGLDEAMDEEASAVAFAAWESRDRQPLLAAAAAAASDTSGDIDLEEDDNEEEEDFAPRFGGGDFIGSYRGGFSSGLGGGFSGPAGVFNPGFVDDEIGGMGAAAGAEADDEEQFPDGEENFDEAEEYQEDEEEEEYDEDGDADFEGEDEDDDEDEGCFGADAISAGAGTSLNEAPAQRPMPKIVGYLEAEMKHEAKSQSLNVRILQVELKMALTKFRRKSNKKMRWSMLQHEDPKKKKLQTLTAATAAAEARDKEGEVDKSKDGGQDKEKKSKDKDKKKDKKKDEATKAEAGKSGDTAKQAVKIGKLSIPRLPGKSKPKEEAGLKQPQEDDDKDLFKFAPISKEKNLVKNPQQALAIRFRLYGCWRKKRSFLLGENTFALEKMAEALQTSDKVRQNRFRLQLEERRFAISKEELEQQKASAKAQKKSAKDSVDALLLPPPTEGPALVSQPELFLGLAYNQVNGHLQVAIVKACNLRNPKSDRPPTAFTKVQLLWGLSKDSPVLFRSKTLSIPYSPNPEWYETFEYPVSRAHLDDVSVMVKVYCKHTLSRTVTIGWCSVGRNNCSEEALDHWGDMRDSKGEQICNWHVLLKLVSNCSSTGPSHFSTGLSHFSTGLSHFSRGPSHFSTGLSHFSTGLSHFSRGPSHFSTGISHFSTGLSHFSRHGSSHFSTGPSHFSTGPSHFYQGLNYFSGLLCRKTGGDLINIGEDAAAASGLRVRVRRATDAHAVTAAGPGGHQPLVRHLGGAQQAEMGAKLQQKGAKAAIEADRRLQADGGDKGVQQAGVGGAEGGHAEAGVHVVDEGAGALHAQPVCEGLQREQQQVGEQGANKAAEQLGVEALVQLGEAQSHLGAAPAVAPVASGPVGGAVPLGRAHHGVVGERPDCVGGGPQAHNRRHELPERQQAVQDARTVRGDVRLHSFHQRGCVEWRHESPGGGLEAKVLSQLLCGAVPVHLSGGDGKLWGRISWQWGRWISWHWGRWISWQWDGGSAGTGDDGSAGSEDGGSVDGGSGDGGSVDGGSGDGGSVDGGSGDGGSVDGGSGDDGSAGTGDGGSAGTGGGSAGSGDGGSAGTGDDGSAGSEDGGSVDGGSGDGEWPRTRV